MYWKFWPFPSLSSLAAYLLPSPMELHLWQWFSWTKQFLCSMLTQWLFSPYRYNYEQTSAIIHQWQQQKNIFPMFVWAWLFCSISLFLQQIATALIIHFGQILGVSKRKDFSMATGRKLLPLSIFYNANVAFALASLKGVNIPMYIAIKRLTPLAVLVAGCLRGKGKPPTQVSAFF